MYLDKPLPEGWPKFGKIVFQNVNLRYSPDAPYILKDLSIIIQPKEKVVLSYINIFK